MSTIEENKAVVVRFNKEVIEQGNMETFNAIMDKDFINRTAAPNIPNGPEGMILVFNNIRAAFPNIKVEIFDQVAEGDMVTTRKAFYATHTGDFMGIPPTNKNVVITVIDMVRLRDGKYFEHWGMNNLQQVIVQLKTS